MNKEITNNSPLKFENVVVTIKKFHKTHKYCTLVTDNVKEVCEVLKDYRFTRVVRGDENSQSTLHTHVNNKNERLIVRCEYK